jgi:hypothetical protein
MKRFLVWVLMAIFVFTIPITRAHAQVAETAALTIGATLEGLRNIVKQLETSASFLLAQGNNALAQQQMLLAGILKSTIEHASVAYADSLNKTFSQMDVAEKNAFDDLFVITKQLSTLEKQTANDVQAIIYKTQGAANQILNRVPLIKRVPIFYGITTRDMMADPSQNPADLEILGFMFSDERLKFKKPIIKVADQIIDDKFVSVQEDRIQVQIPDPLKTKVGFGSNPCNPRKTFPVELDVFYGKPRGFSPITWTSEGSVSFQANTLAGKDRFDVSVMETGSRTTVSQRTEHFVARSGVVRVGCEEGNNGAARFEAPTNATQINCSAGWVDTDSLKSQQASACTVGGTVATATGTITGLDRDCVPIVGGILRQFTGSYSCNCRSGGQGYLAVSGTYQVPKTKVDTFTDAAVGKYVMANGHLSASLGTDSSVKLAKITVLIKRKDCPAELDTVTLMLPENPLAAVTQSSERGMFKSTFRGGQLIIERVNP